MFVYFFSLAIIVFEVICCKMFFESFCRPRPRAKWNKVLLMLLLVQAFYLCGLTLSKWLVIKQIVVIVSVAIVMYVYFEINVKKSIVFAMLYQGILLLVDYFVYIGNSAIISKEGEVHQEYVLEGNLVIIFSKVITFICVLLVNKQFRKKSTEMIADTVWIKFLFFPVFTIITIAAMLMTFHYTENQVQANVLDTIAFGMVIMNVFVYYLINDIVEREAKLHENAILELQVKNQMGMYRSMSENFEIQKQKSHEFKNQILCIESLLQNQEYDVATNYVNKISKSFAQERNVIDTNHVIINAMLNAKYQEAINNQIVFVFRVNDLSRIEMEDEDLVVILANLLNNAIEACEKCRDKRIIKFKFMIEEEMVILSVKNTYSQPVVYADYEYKTSKVIMREEHGVGIKNIIRIVEKYGGEYSIRDENSEFYFSILIPIERMHESQYNSMK